MKYMSYTDKKNSELRVITASEKDDIAAMKRAFGLDVRWFFFGADTFRTTGRAIGALKRAMLRTTFAKNTRPIFAAVIYPTNDGYEVQICYPVFNNI